MPLKTSLYDIAEHLRDDISHKGYDYRGKLFVNTMSNFLFREEKRANILGYMENVMYELVERVKMIKNHVNYVVPKSYRNKN
jgi:hypothetical protein